MSKDEETKDLTDKKKSKVVAANELVEQEKANDNSRLQYLPKPVRIYYTIITIVGILTACYFMLNIKIGGFVIPGTSYYYLIFAFFASGTFLLMPDSKKNRYKVPLYDYVLCMVSLIIPLYFAYNGTTIAIEGWVPAPDNFKLALSGIYALLMLEMVRRAGGKVFFWICVVFGLYPLIADKMPGLLYGIRIDFIRLISFYSYGSEGIIGLPGNITGTILVGFLLFAGLLIATGTGQFFIDLALSLCGRYRGGTAKVAILTSAFFGMMSGSPISNAISGGSITIPAMKKSGYPDYFAAAIEAVAATGGIIMPPVMGTIIFVMVVQSGFTYSQIMVAAIIPALLYYMGLMLQVDAYAARSGMKGMPKEKIPSFLKTLKEGWHVVFVLAFLVFGLLYMRWGSITPYYASFLLFIFSFKDKRYALTPKRLFKVMGDVGKLITTTSALILPFTFIIAGLIITGVSAAFATQLVMVGGGNIPLILLLTIIACYLLGIMGFDIAAYLFFSVSVAPALVQLGLNKMAVHLFLVYYPMLAQITPPVAVTAFVAASIAGADPIKSSWKACQLGIVIYFIPIAWIYNPTIIMQGSYIMGIIWGLIIAAGIWIMAGALGSYLPIIRGCDSKIVRILSLAAGLAIGLANWATAIIGFVVYGVLVLLHFTSKGKLTMSGEYMLSKEEFLIDKI